MNKPHHEAIEYVRAKPGDYDVYVNDNRNGSVYRERSRWYASLYETGTLREDGSDTFAEAKDLIDGYYGDRTHGPMCDCDYCVPPEAILTDDEPTAWTVCPRCETQIAIDDYQEAAGMCDACIIDTTPEPSDYALYQRLDDGFRKAQYFARAGILALALLVGGTAAAAAQNPAVSDSELLYVSRHQNTDGTYSALVFPPIGTPEYSRSCYVQIAFEDHSAIAYCAEDGASYAFDADGQYVPNIPANPVHGPGWYVIEERAS
jgi:hypothetical protein